MKKNPFHGRESMQATLNKQINIFSSGLSCRASGGKTSIIVRFESVKSLLKIGAWQMDYTGLILSNNTSINLKLPKLKRRQTLESAC